MKEILSYAVVAGLCMTGVLFACTVSFPDDGAPNTFQCESAEECVGGQICEENEQGVKVCKEEGGPVCVDEDEDGFGKNDERNTCSECQEKNLCGRDCDDNDPDINPGMAELCDGKDNDCDDPDEIDEPAGTSAEACGEAPQDCPLPGTPPQDGTQFGCAEIDGTRQCAVKGNFSGCCGDKSKSERFGTCKDGSWEMIASECTMSCSG